MGLFTIGPQESSEMYDLGSIVELVENQLVEWNGKKIKMKNEKKYFPRKMQGRICPF